MLLPPLTLAIDDRELLVFGVEREGVVRVPGKELV